MSSKKFCIFTCVLLLLCFSVLNGGCGGGGGGGSSEQNLVDPDTTTKSNDIPAPIVSPDVPPVSPDIPPVSPDTSPDVPPISPDVSPDVPPAPKPESPDVPPAPSGFTVTFNANGGTEVASITLSADGTIEQPADPTKDANIFVGWFKDEEFNEPFIFGADGDKVSRDITLYAQWIDDNPAGFAVDDAVAEVGIIYADGDNPDYVTRNVGLTANSQGLAVNWTSSNPGVISQNGNVTRPVGSNAKVRLTASVISGDYEEKKIFDLTVIHARTVTPEQAKQNTPSFDVTDIELMNESSDAFEIDYNESADVVRAVEGKFTEVKVNNADDALDAAQSVHDATRFWRKSLRVQ